MYADICTQEKHGIKDGLGHLKSQLKQNPKKSNIIRWKIFRLQFYFKAKVWLWDFDLNRFSSVQKYAYSDDICVNISYRLQRWENSKK
jgi:hypothetical protein